MKKNLSFDSFCKTYKLKTDKEKNINCFISTHTQIAYMAYLYGRADGVQDAIEFLKSNNIFKKEDLIMLQDIFIEKDLLKLNDILSTKIISCKNEQIPQ